MTESNLKLPPHLRQPTEPARVPEAEPTEQVKVAADPVFDHAQPLPVLGEDTVTVTTPLGSVTCPPGRLKLNLLHGGMPKRGDHSAS